MKLSLAAILLAACASHTPPVPDASTEEPPRAGAPPAERDAEAWSPCEASRDVLTRIPLPCKPYDVRTDLGRPLP